MELTPDQRKERDSMSAGFDRAAYPFSLMSIDELEAEINRPGVFKTALHKLTKKVSSVLLFLF